MSNEDIQRTRPNGIELQSYHNTTHELMLLTSFNCFSMKFLLRFLQTPVGSDVYFAPMPMASNGYERVQE